MVGSPDIFDVPKEYGFPEAIAQKVRFCGYIQRHSIYRSRARVRQELAVEPHEKLVLVTPGGGADGELLVMTYLEMMANRQDKAFDSSLKSLIVCGYEMPSEQRQLVHQVAAKNPQIKVIDFSDDLLSLMDAADLVVSMGGYNTTCEILSLKKQAIVVPRIHPVQEQWIRAERMAQRHLFYTLHPHDLSTETLATALKQKLNEAEIPRFLPIDLNALPRITQMVKMLSSTLMPSFSIPPRSFTPTSPHLATANR